MVRIKSVPWKKRKTCSKGSLDSEISNADIRSPESSPYLRRRPRPKSLRHAPCQFFKERKPLRSESADLEGETHERKELFDKLVSEWRQGVKVQSSMAKISFHPAYQAILAMGKDALPFILQDLDERLDHWFYALHLITQEDVGRGAKSLEEAREQWLAWGRKSGLIE
jgi:hypothetical protein